MRNFILSMTIIKQTHQLITSNLESSTFFIYGKSQFALLPLTTCCGYNSNIFGNYSKTLGQVFLGLKLVNNNKNLTSQFCVACSIWKSFIGPNRQRVQISIHTMLWEIQRSYFLAAKSHPKTSHIQKYILHYFVTSLQKCFQYE